MVEKKPFSSFRGDVKRFFNSNSVTRPTAIPASHGCLTVATKNTNSAIPRILRGSTSRNHSIAVPKSQSSEVYESLEKTVGIGATGPVRLWRARSIGKSVAVKEFRDRLPGELKSQYDQRINIEFAIGASFNHGNLIQVVELIRSQDRYFQVMEYVPYDLFATVASKGMSSGEINCIFRQIVAGVQHIHDTGFAHRDMKLDNILLSQHGIVKIIDFGTAVPSKHPIKRQMTIGDGVIGSLPYIAPEMFHASSYDGNALDVWAVAIIFCVMILGRFPWGVARHENAAFSDFVRQTLASRKDKDTEKQLSTLMSQIPAESRPVIARMLEIGPDQRPTCSMVLQDPWVKQISFCHEHDSKTFHKSEEHKHTLCKQ